MAIHNVHTVRAPVTFDLSRPRCYPDRRAASCHQDLRAQVTLLTVHQITYVVRTFHPFMAPPCCSTLSSCSSLLITGFVMLSAMSLHILRSCSSQVSLFLFNLSFFSFLCYHCITRLWQACGLLLAA